MKIIKKLEESLKEIFSKKISRNCWVYTNEAKVYIRISKRYINGSVIDCLDLATIEVEDRFQNKGVFKEILKEMERFAFENQLNLYVENVLNEVLADKLQSYGYEKTNSLMDISPCFIKFYNKANIEKKLKMS